MIDLQPATDQLTRLLAGIGDDQLATRTPCTESTLGDLVDHVGGLSLAFTAAANKDAGSATAQGPSADASRLGGDWRTRIPDQLAALAEAWCKPDAWEGMTRAGGLDLPSQVAGIVALDEVVVHGWDIARATGQSYDPDPQTLEACLQFVLPMSAPEQQAGREGLFGPVVDVPADASLLDRLIGLTGRDPSWTR